MSINPFKNIDRYAKWHSENYDLLLQEIDDNVCYRLAEDCFDPSEVAEAIEEITKLFSCDCSSYVELNKYRKYAPILLWQSINVSRLMLEMHELLDNLNGENANKNKRWTKEEDEILIELVCDGRFSMLEIALRLGRTPNAVQTRITNLVGVNRLSQQVAGRFIGEINGEQTEASIVGTIYKGERANG